SIQRAVRDLGTPFPTPANRDDTSESCRCQPTWSRCWRRSRRAAPPNCWLFVSGNRKPEGHFLRKLKTHALGLLFVWRDSVRKDWRQHVSSRRAVREPTATAQ